MTCMIAPGMIWPLTTASLLSRPCTMTIRLWRRPQHGVAQRDLGWCWTGASGMPWGEGHGKGSLESRGGAWGRRSFLGSSHGVETTSRGDVLCHELSAPTAGTVVVSNAGQDSRVIPAWAEALAHFCSIASNSPSFTGLLT